MRAAPLTTTAAAVAVALAGAVLLLDAAGVTKPAWFVTKRPAMLALESVEIIPEISALTARRETSPLLPGEI